MADSIPNDVIKLAPDAAPPALAGLMLRVLECGSFDDLPGSVIDPVSKAIGACSGVFMQFLGSPLDGETVGRTGAGDDNMRRANDRYVDGLYTIDPMVRPVLAWLRAGKAVPERTVGLLTEVPGWRDEVAYRRFLERFGIGDVLAVAVPAATAFGPEVMCLGFHRPASAKPFTERERSCVQGLLPALRAVLRNLAHTDALDLSRHLLGTRAEAGEGSSLLVLDQDLRVRHFNGGALQRLAERHGERNLQTDILGALRKRLTELPPLMGERLRMGLRGEDSKSSGSRVAQIDISTFQTMDGRRYYLVTEPAGLDEDPDGSRRFGLTDREREVVVFVCRGLSSAAIARELDIARRTVENHLRSIFAKVGVNSRTQLAVRWLDSDRGSANRAG